METRTVPTELGQDGRVWRTDDVMWYLQCSRTQIWQYIRRMALPCHKLNEKNSPLLFDPEKVKQWAREHEIDVTRKVAS
jgi:hypothetical protein